MCKVFTHTLTHLHMCTYKHTQSSSHIQVHIYTHIQTYTHLTYTLIHRPGTFSQKDSKRPLSVKLEATAVGRNILKAIPSSSQSTFYSDESQTHHVCGMDTLHLGTQSLGYDQRLAPPSSSQVFLFKGSSYCVLPASGGDRLLVQRPGPHSQCTVLELPSTSTTIP